MKKLSNQRYWQNWDRGQISESIDCYWCNSEAEIKWRELLVSDIETEFGKNTSVLEVGCGSGLIYQEILEHHIVSEFQRKHIPVVMSVRICSILLGNVFPKPTLSI